MAKDKRTDEKYIFEDPEAVIRPYFRINPPLRYGIVNSVAAMADEYVLPDMHSSDAELLVISTKRILIYKIPAKTSFLRKLGKEAISFTKSVTLDAIPLVSEASTLLGSVGFKRRQPRLSALLCRHPPLRLRPSRWQLHHHNQRQTIAAPC